MAEAEKKTITDLAQAVNTKTLHLVLLAAGTLGLWEFIYMRDKQMQISEITGCPKPIGTNGLIICAIVLFMHGLYQQLSGLAGLDEFTLGFGWVLSISAYAICLVWSFRARKAIRQYAIQEFLFDYPINPFLTFLLRDFYVNYKINCLAEKYLVYKAMRGETPPTAKQD